VDRNGKPLGTDFSNVYAAGRLTWQGRAADAYQPPLQHAAEKAVFAGRNVPFFGWHYPPFFFAIAFAVAAFPYAWGLVIWIASSLAAYLMVIRAILPRPQTLLVAAAFPAVFVNIGHGHNGFLTAALLGGALHLLDRRPWLAGVLIGARVIDPSAFVPDYIATLRGTSWEGCTVQHLLDMRAGTRFDEEDYENLYSDGVLIEQISGYRPSRRSDLPANTYAWIMALTNDGVHGGPFRYRSILTDVLAWAAAEAAGTRFPDLFSRLIWSRIGAERDAEVIVDAAGFAVVEGGICTTLRDLARFGLMHLDDGAAGGERVVPAAWIARLLERDEDLIAAYDRDLLGHLPNAFYHDQWWVWDAAAGIYSGYGINGQQLLIHRPTRTVIARFSTWPTRSDERLFRYAEATNLALLEHLG